MSMWSLKEREVNEDKKGGNWGKGGEMCASVDNFTITRFIS